MTQVSNPSIFSNQDSTTTGVFLTQKALKLLPWFIFPQPLKLCPSQNPRESEFFRSLLGGYCSNALKPASRSRMEPGVVCLGRTHQTLGLSAGRAGARPDGGVSAHAQRRCAYHCQRPHPGHSFARCHRRLPAQYLALALPHFPNPALLDPHERGHALLAYLPGNVELL